jgi:pyruvate/oxaloacetate carboxyltransferase
MMHILEQEFDKIVAEKSLTLADNKIDDLLTYALFPQVSINFIENRNNAEPFYQGHFARAIGFPYWSTYRQALVIIKFWSLRL